MAILGRVLCILMLVGLWLPYSGSLSMTYFV